MEDIRLNVPLLRQRVPNLTSAARSVGLRSATVSNLCTGKIPVGRAEVRTLVALASLAKCSLDELILIGEEIEMIETGIKTLDLFAPLVKGGTAGLVARPKMGQLVVLAELFYRLKQQGYVTVLLKPEGDHPEIEDVAGDAEIVCNSVDEAFTQISNIGSTKDVVLSSDRSHVISNEIYNLQNRLHKSGVVSLTTLLVDLKGEAIDEGLPYGPLETLWQFDADLAVRHIYPAVNPVLSTSEIIEGADTDSLHQSIGQKAKKLLRRYKELRFLVQVHGMEALPNAETQTFMRGERLEAYLTQPLYVAEAFTGTAGVNVSLQEALQDVQRILDGDVDERDTKELMYIGRLQ
ncbi:ATP synthase subunit B [Cohnella kolymensis]|uniref:ATP synthase subunit B n=1 Tax=Cohnella kolymensis TaxID=1590652 RepID=A0ABR5AAE5_9BACL|nr:ATP synthase subunit B [Cohnella kolymensis]KIL37653.1 ATP synthase subunit B [Cohnella kolymensis]